MTVPRKISPVLGEDNYTKPTVEGGIQIELIYSRNFSFTLPDTDFFSTNFKLM